MRVSKRVPQAFALLGLTGLLMGPLACGGKAARKVSRLEESLTEAAEDHWQAMRWESYGEAGSFADDPEAWALFEEALRAETGRFNLTHVEVVRVVVRLPDSEGEAVAPEGRVYARLELTTLPSNKLETRNATQVWTHGSWGWTFKVEGEDLQLFLPKEDTQGD